MSHLIFLETSFSTFRFHSVKTLGEAFEAESRKSRSGSCRVWLGTGKTSKSICGMHVSFESFLAAAKWKDRKELHHHEVGKELNGSSASSLSASFFALSFSLALCSALKRFNVLSSVTLCNESPKLKESQRVDFSLWLSKGSRKPTNNIALHGKRKSLRCRCQRYIRGSYISICLASDGLTWPYRGPSSRINFTFSTPFLKIEWAT